MTTFSEVWYVACNAQTDPKPYPAAVLNWAALSPQNQSIVSSLNRAANTGQTHVMIEFVREIVIAVNT